MDSHRPFLSRAVPAAMTLMDAPRWWHAVGSERSFFGQARCQSSRSVTHNTQVKTLRARTGAKRRAALDSFERKGSAGPIASDLRPRYGAWRARSFAEVVHGSYGAHGVIYLPRERRVYLSSVAFFIFGCRTSHSHRWFARGNARSTPRLCTKVMQATLEIGAGLHGQKMVRSAGRRFDLNFPCTNRRRAEVHSSASIAPPVVRDAGAPHEAAGRSASTACRLGPSIDACETRSAPFRAPAFSDTSLGARVNPTTVRSNHCMRGVGAAAGAHVRCARGGDRPSSSETVRGSVFLRHFLAIFRPIRARARSRACCAAPTRTARGQGAARAPAMRCLAGRTK
jgi:hypothetical protein